MDKDTILKIIDILYESYKDAKCALNFKSPYELLVATILSAQCTDVRVNKVTKELFKNYNTPEKMITLTQEQLGEMIKSCGLYKNKSKNIISSSHDIIDKFEGKVPDNLEDLMSLSGVGRKTANVVLSNAFNVPAIAVDTHVFRVSNRIGIGKGKNPKEVEMSLRNNLPKETWSHMHHCLISHGRKICASRKPKCDICPLIQYCEFYNGKQ